MEQPELGEILTAHALWAAGRRGGKKAKLARADLKGVDLSGMQLKGADLKGADLRGALLDGADLTKVDLTGANLAGASLQGATCKEACLEKTNLTQASFIGANLGNARLSAARMVGTNFEGAKLGRAGLTEAVLEHVDLRKFDLRDAHAPRSTFKECDLRGARLSFSDLEGSSFVGSVMQEIDLSRSDMTDAILKSVNLQRANLRDVSLNGADLRNADLRGSNLNEADLTMADLRGADLRGANLNRVVLLDANLEGAHLDESFALVEPEARVALGKRRTAIRRAEISVGQSAQAFKQQFPEAHEKIGKDIAGRNLTAELIRSIVEQYGFNWIVTYGEYEKKAQRLSGEPNRVLQLNIDIYAMTADPWRRKQMEAMRFESVLSGHPVVRSGRLLTVGWVRYSVLKVHKVLLVEEIQSDIALVRRGKDEEKGLTQERERARVEIVAMLAPFSERFYEDAMSLIFDIAANAGCEVEMLTYDVKAATEEAPPPRSVYTDLPKRMGMKLRGESKGLPDLPEVWHAVPNRRRV